VGVVLPGGAPLLAIRSASSGASAYFASEREGSVVANLKRKDQDAQAMAAALSLETRDAIRTAVLGTSRQSNDYNPQARIIVPQWLRSEAA
jgi:hypothetical protein